MFTLETGLFQQQRVTTQLVQSMHILQMSTPELEAYLEALAMENPVIELEETAEDPNDTPQWAMHMKQEWLSSSDWQNRAYRDADNTENLWHDHSGETLADYLYQQLLSEHYRDKEAQVLSVLINCLDRDGYFREDLSAIARQCGTSRDTVDRLLRVVQTLEPTGVGATDLRECLLLQAQRRYPEDRLLAYVITEHLSDIAKNHLGDVSRRLGVPISRITACRERIRTLNPRPGSGFADNEQPRYIRPDALILELQDRFEVILRDTMQTTFQTSSFYRDLAETTDDRETHNYLLEKLRQAETVAAGITMRRANLKQLLDYLVVYQEDFFRLGPGHKRPMKLSDLAVELQLHPSTISRTMREKYLQCNWGVFPLGYFLTGVAVVSPASGDSQTQEEIKQKLQTLIDTEDKKKPLSDESLSRLLGEQYQIPIARRTVNKYRQEMNIPDRSGRKVWA